MFFSTFIIIKPYKIKKPCFTAKFIHKNLFRRLYLQNRTLKSSFLLKHLPIHLWLSPRPISNIQLHTLLHFHLCPIYLILSKGSYLTGISHLEGGFTLRCLQRLSLPDLATLPWHWLPTDTPVVRPPRSSRTKGSSSQISYACAG